MRRIGIRTRIAGGSLLIAMLLSTAAGIVIDSQLTRIVREGTVAVLTSDAAPYVLALTDEPDEDLDPPGPGQSIAVLDGNGRTVIDTLPVQLATDLDDLLATGGTLSVLGSGEERYLVRATEVEVDGEAWYVIAARSAAAEDEVLGQMRALVIGGLAVISLGAAASALLLTTASLRPVNRLRVSAQNLSAESTASASDELLPVGPASDEISRLAETLNDLILRLRESAARERQLVSDASHELRTPLAILRTQLELARRDATSVEQLVDDVGAAERSAERLGDLVTSMLTLSSLEAGAHEGHASISDLVAEVDAAVGRARFRARDSGVTIDYAPPAMSVAGTVAARAEDVGRVVDNLVGNALAAMSGEGALSIDLETDTAWVRLSVADTGGGMAADFVPRAFERFARSDVTRGKTPGAGLGLPIIAAIVERAGGSIHLKNDEGVGLTVAVTIPTVTPSGVPHGTFDPAPDPSFRPL